MDILSQAPGAKASTPREAFWSFAERCGIEPITAWNAVQVVLYGLKVPALHQSALLTLGVYGLVAVAPAYYLQREFDKALPRRALTKAVLVGFSIGAPLLGVPVLVVLGALGAIVAFRRSIRGATHRSK